MTKPKLSWTTSTLSAVIKEGDRRQSAIESQLQTVHFGQVTTPLTVQSILHTIQHDGRHYHGSCNS